MGFVFKRSDSGQCPACIAFGRKWYIQDRLRYSDGYGDVWEYCLMSVSLDPPPVRCFNDKSQIASWLNGFENYREKDEWWTEELIRRKTKWDCDYGDLALVVKDGVQYRYDKKKLTLTALPERIQETCWYDSYRECLSEAKRFLRDKQMARCG